MLARELALRLRAAGLVWRPQAGDAFQLLESDMDSTGAEAFVVSDLTVEAHDYPTGTVLGFNGTTEWALDSVALEETVWLPREGQLREALKSTFVRLERDAELGWIVHTVFRGLAAETAYALALLDEVLASA